MAISEQPNPILRVTVGTPVYSADDQKLGKVKEVRGEHFKVETGLFQRDYWLPSTVIAEAVPEHSVLLNAPRADLDAYKSTDEPAAAA
jgi:hypothetical protein